MNTVWKYQIAIVNLDKNNEIRIEIPDGAKVLFVEQGGDPRYVTFWAEVFTSNPLTHRRFRVFGTGHPIPLSNRIERLEYRGTAVTNVGIVWHLYEAVEEERF